MDEMEMSQKHSECHGKTMARIGFLQDAGCFGEGSLGVRLRVFLVVIASRNPAPLGNVDLPMVEWSRGLSSLYKYWEQGPLLRFVMICVQSLRLRCPATLGEGLE